MGTTENSVLSTWGALTQSSVILWRVHYYYISISQMWKPRPRVTELIVSGRSRIGTEAVWPQSLHWTTLHLLLRSSGGSWAPRWDSGSPQPPWIPSTTAYYHSMGRLGWRTPASRSLLASLPLQCTLPCTVRLVFLMALLSSLSTLSEASRGNPSLASEGPRMGGSWRHKGPEALHPRRKS